MAGKVQRGGSSRIATINSVSGTSEAMNSASPLMGVITSPVSTVFSKLA